MSSFRKLYRRTRNRMIRLLVRESKVKARLRKLAARLPKADGLAKKMENHIRRIKAEALIDQIEDKLKGIRDPEERMALHASIETVRLLAEKGGEVPETLEELTQFQNDVLTMMHRFCTERLSPLLMSPRMLEHAAKSEKGTMKN